MQKHVLALPVFALLLTAATAVGPASAAGPEIVPLGPTLDVSGASPAGACVISPYTPGNVLYFLGATDRIQSFYHLVRAGSCPSCTGGMIQLNSITYRSRTAGDPTCTYRVEVSVVGVTPGACPAPDDANVLCPPTIVDVTVLSATSNIVVPLPTGWCISQDAYVRLRFLDDTLCGSAAILHPLIQSGAEPCAPCDQYFTSLTGWPALTEVCTLFTQSNLYMSVNADCCAPTPARPESWGRVKRIYR